jgi:hypothetical protein
MTYPDKVDFSKLGTKSLKRFPKSALLAEIDRVTNGEHLWTLDFNHADLMSAVHLMHNPPATVPATDQDSTAPRVRVFSAPATVVSEPDTVEVLLARIAVLESAQTAQTAPVAVSDDDDARKPITTVKRLAADVGLTPYQARKLLRKYGKVKLSHERNSRWDFYTQAEIDVALSILKRK